MRNMRKKKRSKVYKSDDFGREIILNLKIRKCTWSTTKIKIGKLSRRTLKMLKTKM